MKYFVIVSCAPIAEERGKYITDLNQGSSLLKPVVPLEFFLKAIRLSRI